MSEATQNDAGTTEDSQVVVVVDTRSVRVPEKFTQRFLLGADVNGETTNSEGVPLFTTIGGDSTLITNILAATPKPRGNGGFTREVTVTRDEYQELYALVTHARQYMQNIDKEESKSHRENTLAAAVGANAVCDRMEKDEVWGIDNPIVYTPKRRNGKKKVKAEAPAEVTPDVTDGAAETTDGAAETTDGDIAATYESPTLSTADDAAELPAEDQTFINQDVASGS